ncbi:MAG TPA: tetratricopeptide repeat protein [Kofleriaceae bacterium]|nr:tetratricopeptide repeat protein [Kofleriaceae bacterium]
MTTDSVLELYSIRDAARLFGLAESRLRYWIQTGFVRPSVRQGGRFYYTFADLIALKAAVELLSAGVSQERVRAALDRLRTLLPERVSPTSRLRVCSDGETLAVVDDDRPVASRQLVMTFAVSSIGSPTRRPTTAPAPTEEAAPEPAAWGATEPQRLPSAYQCFLEGCRAEDAGDHGLAELCYRRALELEPSLAAAHTNLGNLAYARGEIAAARRAYERALDLEPDQAEARYNLANLLDELGDTDLAVAELRAVCSRHPTFADAHYNLGLLLFRLGGVAQARHHLGQYLAIDPASEWSTRARTLLESA